MPSAPLILFVRFIYAVCITVAYSFSTVDNIPVHRYAVTTYDRVEWFFNPSKNTADGNVCVYLSG